MITRRRNQVIAQVFLFTFAILWLVPLFGMVVAAFRPFSETSVEGFFSWPDTLTLDNFRDAWERGDMARHWFVTFVVVVAVVVVVL